MAKAYLSKLAKPPLIEYLKEQGYDLFFVGNQRPGQPRFESNVDVRISTHADIYMCQLGLWEEAGLYMGDADELGETYPKDAIFNAVCTKDFFIHNLVKRIVERHIHSPKLMPMFSLPQGIVRLHNLPHDQGRQKEQQYAHYAPK